MAFNTMGKLASPGVLDLGLGQITVDQMSEQLAMRRKKKLLASANGNPGAYGDVSLPATRQIFGLQ